MTAVIDASSRILEEKLSTLPALLPAPAWYGTGGTFTTLAAMVNGVPWTDRTHMHGTKLTCQQIEKEASLLAPMSPEERKLLPGLQPNRADIIVHGICILIACMRTLQIPEITVSEYGNLDGFLMQDFTVQTLDGSFHLSEVLQEKKMVLINFFASWCGPCKMEFPYMEEAYKQYADSVAVLALSVEPNDTTDVLRSYAEENGLSFSVGSDAGAGISAQFDTSAIPVTVVVDRFGQIVLEEAGARSSADDFIHLFDYMTSDYYTKSVPLNGFPSGRADAESETPEKLAEALGEGITFRNPESPFVWPMKTATDGDRLVLQSTAPLESGAISSLTVQASAHEGDALAFEYRTDSTPGVNLLTVNTAENAPVFVFGGKSDWAGHAISLHEGENTLTFSFTVALPFS